MENFLLTTDGELKLCDFGSATTETYAPDVSWSAQQRDMLEDQVSRIEKVKILFSKSFNHFHFQLASITTPMYRCPEQLDLWSNYPIGPKSDVWALGCVIYYLCFQRHPFEDSAKLRIVNANFTLPGDSRYTCFHEIIKGCLQVDPNKRFDVSMILDRLGAISETKGWPLKGPVKLKVSFSYKKKRMTHHVEVTQYSNISFISSYRGNQLKHHQI